MPALDERLHLRHAEARGHARRAAAAGADADLDAVDAALGRNRAPSAVATLPAISSTSPNRLRNSLDRALHDHRMAVRDVDDEHVHAGLDQLRGALEVIAGRADRGADAQAALRVARGERQPPLLDDILARVTRPSSVPSASTSGSFLILRSTIIRSASAERERRPRATTSRSSGVIRSATRSAVAVDEAQIALGQQARAACRARRPRPACRRRDRAISADRLVDAAPPARRCSGSRDDAVLRALDDLHLAHLRLRCRRRGSRDR